VILFITVLLLNATFQVFSFAFFGMDV